MTGYLLVRSAGHQYGLLIDQVLEVLDEPSVDGALGVHAAVRGVTQLRGRIVPVVNLGALLADGEPGDAAGGTVVLVRMGVSVVALEVDDVEEVVIESLLPIPKAWELPWAAGVARRSGAYVPVVNLELLGERLTSIGGGGSP